MNSVWTDPHPMAGELENQIDAYLAALPPFISPLPPLVKASVLHLLARTYRTAFIAGRSDMLEVMMEQRMKGGQADGKVRDV